MMYWETITLLALCDGRVGCGRVPGVWCGVKAECDCVYWWMRRLQVQAGMRVHPQPRAARQAYSTIGGTRYVN